MCKTEQNARFCFDKMLFALQKATLTLADSRGRLSLQGVRYVDPYGLRVVEDACPYKGFVTSTPTGCGSSRTSTPTYYLFTLHYSLFTNKNKAVHCTALFLINY